VSDDTQLLMLSSVDLICRELVILIQSHDET